MTNPIGILKSYLSMTDLAIPVYQDWPADWMNTSRIPMVAARLSGLLIIGVCGSKQFKGSPARLHGTGSLLGSIVHILQAFSYTGTSVIDVVFRRTALRSSNLKFFSPTIGLRFIFKNGPQPLLLFAHNHSLILSS